MIKYFYPVCLFSRENIEDLPILNKKYHKTSSAKGLCNQIFALINGINKAKRNNKKFVIIDSFLRCIVRCKICPISNIFDLQEMSKSFNIKILDRLNINLNIIYSSYGTKEKYIDITEKIKTLLSINNIILDKNVKLNETFGDPCFGHKKKIYIKYSINDYPLEITVDEYGGKLKSDINLDIDYIKKKMWKGLSTSFSWYNPEKKKEFIEDLRKIKFNNNFFKILEKLNPVVKNCVHLRLEPDSINHWSRVNKLNHKEFYNKLVQKYNKIISENIIETQDVFLLIHDLDHTIITDLRQKYNVKNLEYGKSDLIYKHIKYSGREISAIVDLLIGSYCNDIFIGCHSLKYNRGSTFSLTLLALNNSKKNILIDLDDINREEEIY